MSKRYHLNSTDYILLTAAKSLLQKAAEAQATKPAQHVSIAKLQHVLALLPKVTSSVDVEVSVVSPRREFGEIVTFHWWTVAVEDERISISSGGHFFRPGTGGDTFSTMFWTAEPGFDSELNDYRDSLGIVPDVRSFPDGVASIDLNASGFRLEVTDEENSLLEEAEDDEESDDEFIEDGTTEEGDEDDEFEPDGALGDLFDADFSNRSGEPPSDPLRTLSKLQMANGQNLSDTEMALLIAWNLAAGYWQRVGLTPAEAKQLMLDFAKQFRGNPAQTIEHSRVTLQQTLMALRRGSFEEIQGEAPFRQHAQQNLLHLLTSYAESGDSGIVSAWHQVFPQNREVQPATYEPIRVIENDSESADTASEVVGAPDRATRVAAEWWYLRYRFGRNFTPGMHMTTVANANGDCFSVHNIALPDGSRKQVFFRLRGGLSGTATTSTLKKGTLSLATAISDQTGAKQRQTDLQQVSDYIGKVTKLPETGLVWLLGWNIVAGQWDRIGLNPQAAKEYLTEFFDKLQGDVTDLSKRSAEQLQQGLMALRIGTFEDIQQEPPFSRFAQRNMESLLRAWRDGGESRFAQLWNSIFHPGWEDGCEHQYPVRVIGGLGDSERRAFEVLSASDRQSRTPAEFWYMFYTFGDGWKWEKHETIGDDHGGPQFSVHHIRILPDSARRVYFRLSW